MAGWSRSFWPGGGRFSPFSSSAPGNPPQVTDDDYSYITADDITAPQPSYDQNHSARPPQRPSADDDIILLRINSTVYPLHFAPYSIDDGLLTVSDLKMRAAEISGTGDARRIKLLYKGRTLKDEYRPCRDEGLKIDSEVLCVVSDDKDSQDDDDATDTDGNSTGAAGDSGTTKRRRQRGRKKKTKKSGAASAGGGGASGAAHLAPPDAGGSRTSRSTSPAAPKTSLGKLDQISSHFRSQLLPQSVQFTNNPPTDPAKKDYEHKKLTETILSQVLLKLDAVDTEGDAEARQRRKDLVKETQGVLNGLDAVMKKEPS
ncbi:MAG: hypothetical protein M1832_005957 [Thelocarpon impressellum]|nr:MAG: hypothetical protein M1832_005957 [Thelocarpon impressellum]